ncbi:hypothetical protein CYMTET_28203 [Cymbomonas tetramitiformis]|uniref:Uncharacterized protein n=1 Tax=Cymbomonas tetramitiformis TaxID=36881 RepID=A0AAE0KWG2_9CHLO|nr:hypothetical protein CYMTET_28203 [Cymbomonas tetramitiformis]
MQLTDTTIGVCEGATMFTAKLNNFYQFPQKNQRDDYREFFQEIYGDLMNEPAKEEVLIVRPWMAILHRRCKRKNKEEAELTRLRLSGNADTLARLRKSNELKQETAKQLSQVGEREPKFQARERPNTVGTMGEMQPSEMANPELDHENDPHNPTEDMSQSQLKEYMGEFAYYNEDHENHAVESTQRMETTTSYMNSYGGNIAKLKANVQKARAEKKDTGGRVEVTAPYGKVVYHANARKPKSGKMLIPSYLLKERNLPKNNDETSEPISKTMKKLAISSQRAERCLMQVAAEDRKAAIKLGLEKTRSAVPLGNILYNMGTRQIMTAYELSAFYIRIHGRYGGGNAGGVCVILLLVNVLHLLTTWPPTG